MSIIDISYSSSNSFVKDNNSGEDYYNIDDNFYLPQFSITGNSYFSNFSDDKLNNDMIKNFDIPIIEDKKINFEKYQIKHTEFSIISTNVNKKNEDNKNNNYKLNLDDNKINLNEKFKNNKNIFIEINLNSENKIKEKNKILGRKRKDKKEIGIHNKLSEDNIMRKIKSFLFNAFNDLLNESLKDKNIKFLNLDGEISKNLKKDYNIILLNTKIKDLYEKSSISKKYRNKNLNNNKIIIKKIYIDNKEIETIKILNLTYRELLQIFRRNISNINLNLEEKIQNIKILNTNEYKNIIDKFFDDIIIQGLKNNENEKDIKEYINNIKNLIINYEYWFWAKKGRDRKKNR